MIRALFCAWLGGVNNHIAENFGQKILFRSTNRQSPELNHGRSALYIPVAVLKNIQSILKTFCTVSRSILIR